MQRNIVSPTKGSIVYYKSDGSGRDTYIHNQNGGFLGKDLIHQMRNKPSQVKERMRFGKPARAKAEYAPESKFPHYISDGSGRDFYVSCNDGGNVRVPRWRDEVGFKFRSTLREYHKLPTPNPEKADIFAISQSQMTRSQTWRNKNLSHQQFYQTQRLSQPKTSRNPPPVASYFSTNYNRCRSTRVCDHSPCSTRN